MVFTLFSPCSHQVLFQKWLRYMRYALSEAPSERTVALTRVRQQLEDLDGMIQELNVGPRGWESIGNAKGTEVEDLGKQLHELFDPPDRLHMWFYNDLLRSLQGFALVLHRFTSF